MSLVKETPLERNVKVEAVKKDKYYKNIDLAAVNINKYFEESSLTDNIPETKILVYNRICYPIIYEIPSFFYLGGNNLYQIMKKKCNIQETTNGTRFYEAVASEADIVIGKSPIIPVGCPGNKSRVYPKDTKVLETKV